MLCKFCGKEVADGAKFCRFCGQKLAEETAPQQVNNGSAEPVSPSVDSSFDNSAVAENNVNPFGGQPVTPVAENPFGAQPATPVAENPFGAQPATPVAENPFGAQPASPVAENPFGAQPASPVAENPFGGQPSAPVAENPFGPQPSAPAAENPFGAQPASPVAENPFGAQPASPVAENPFGAQPVTPVAENPFGAQPASPVAENPFGAPVSEQPSQMPFEQPPVAAPFGQNEVWNPEFDSKKAKKEKKQKQKENKGSGAQTAKIVIMILLQLVFIGGIALLAIKGKMTNDMGDINLGLTIGAFVGVLAVDVLLYFILFAGKSSQNQLAPPPVFQSHDNAQNVPMYMNVSQDSSNQFAMGNIEKTDRDRLLDNDDRFSAPNGTPFGMNTPPVQNAPFMQETAPVQNSFASNVSEQSASAPVVEQEAYAETYVQEEFASTQILDGPVYGDALVKYPKLSYTDNGTAMEVEVNKPEFIMGRMTGKVDCVITNKSVGRIHAAIITRDGEYYLKDLNSKNKSYINRGTPLNPEQEYKLNDNDIISLADSELVFKLPQ